MDMPETGLSYASIPPFKETCPWCGKERSYDGEGRPGGYRTTMPAECSDFAKCGHELMAKVQR